MRKRKVVSVSISLPIDLVELIREVQERRMDPSFSDTVRSLLVVGLTSISREEMGEK